MKTKFKYRNLAIVGAIALMSVIVVAAIVMRGTSTNVAHEDMPDGNSTVTQAENTPSTSDDEVNASTQTTVAPTTTTTTSRVVVTSTTATEHTTATSVEYVPTSQISGEADVVSTKATSGKTQILTTAATTTQKYEEEKVTPIILPTATSPGVVYEGKEVSQTTTTDDSDEVVDDVDLPSSFEDGDAEEDEVGIELEDVDDIPSWLMAP